MNNKLYTNEGDECLTKCYGKNEKIFNPRTLTFRTAEFNGTCAIEPRRECCDVETFKHGLINMEMGQCAENNSMLYPDEKIIMMSYHFDPIYFIKYFYDLKTFDAVIRWTNDNTESAYATINRVHNCAWHIFGRNKDNITDTVIKYYYQIAVKKWMPRFINSITKTYSFNITSDEPVVTDKSVPNVDPKRDEPVDPTSDNISHFIVKKFLTYDFFVSIFNKYIDEFKKDNDVIVKPHDKLIRKFLYKHLVEHIKDILKVK